MHYSFEELLEECLIDYSDPIFIVGEMDIHENDNITVISATIPKEELVIINEIYPKWYFNVLKKSNTNNNILVIKDFEQISIEEQKLFMDIICKNTFSSEKLPDNLKIIINAKNVCQILPDIREVIQYIEA